MDWGSIPKTPGPLPNFDVNGNLPPGHYEPTKEEFERVFIKAKEFRSIPTKPDFEENLDKKVLLPEIKQNILAAESSTQNLNSDNKEKIDVDVQEKGLRWIIKKGKKEFFIEKEGGNLKFYEVESGFSPKRLKIYNGLKRFCTDLLNTGVAHDSLIMIDGSFVSNKRDPSDVDFAVAVSLASSKIYDPLFSKIYKADLLKGSGNKIDYLCDAYPVWVVPKSDPYYQTLTENDYVKWLNFFSCDRKNNKKGLIWFKISGLI